MAGNVVEIQVNAKTKQARQGLDTIKGRMGAMKTQTAGLSQSFGSLNRMLGIVGLSSIGFGVVLKQFADTSARLASTQALTNLKVEDFGPAAIKALKEIDPLLGAIAKDFGFTGSEARIAYGIIATETHRGVASVRELEYALGLARVASISLEEASRLIGRAILDGGRELREKYFPAMGDAVMKMEDLAEAGKEATTEFHKLAAAWTDTKERIAQDPLQFILDVPAFQENINDMIAELVGFETTFVTMVTKLSTAWDTLWDKLMEKARTAWGVIKQFIPEFLLPGKGPTEGDLPAELSPGDPGFIGARQFRPSGPGNRPIDEFLFQGRPLREPISANRFPEPPGTISGQYMAGRINRELIGRSRPAESVTTINVINPVISDPMILRDLGRTIRDLLAEDDRRGTV